MSHLPAHRQTLLFSATIPQQIKSLADEMLHNPLNISIGKSKDSSVTANITHTVLWVEEDCKKTRLFTFLNDKDTYHPPVVVFVNSRRGTLLLASAIDKVCDIAAIAIHGEMEQERRSTILKDFLNGRYQVIVATGVLARGLDLTHVQQVTPLVYLIWSLVPLLL
jgi:ATP-dependent RNA helicase DDX59